MTIFGLKSLWLAKIEHLSLVLLLVTAIAVAGVLVTGLVVCRLWLVDGDGLCDSLGLVLGDRRLVDVLGLCGSLCLCLGDWWLPLRLCLGDGRLPLVLSDGVGLRHSLVLDDGRLPLGDIFSLGNRRLPLVLGNRLSHGVLLGDGLCLGDRGLVDGLGDSVSDSLGDGLGLLMISVVSARAGEYQREREQRSNHSRELHVVG